MDEKRISQSEIENLRGLLAGLAFETKLIRLRRRLVRDGRAIKGWEDQPRAPSGRSDGGQWIRGPGGQWASLQQDAPPASSAESTTLEDGTRVLSIRIHAGPRAFDEQHTVISPDGDSRVFETIGATQTIRDGETGDVLSRATFTPSTLVPEPVVQPAFFQGPLAGAVTTALRNPRTLQFLWSLLSALAGRKGGFGPVLGLTAHEFAPGDQPSNGVVGWVGELSQDELNATCPRNGEVMAITDDVTQRIKTSNNFLDARNLGNLIHREIARIVNDRRDPNFRAEILQGKRGVPLDPNASGNVRLDLLENIPETRTVCVYDYKTGIAGISMARAFELAEAVLGMNKNLIRIIIIQVRPQI